MCASASFLRHVPAHKQLKTDTCCKTMNSPSLATVTHYEQTLANRSAAHKPHLGVGVRQGRLLPGALGLGLRQQLLLRRLPLLPLAPLLLL